MSVQASEAAKFMLYDNVMTGKIDWIAYRMSLDSRHALWLYRASNSNV